METHGLSCKKKVLGTIVNKENHADSLLEHKRTNTDFLEKDITVNSVSYYQPLNKIYLIYKMTLIYIHINIWNLQNIANQNISLKVSLLDVQCQINFMILNLTCNIINELSM